MKRSVTLGTIVGIALGVVTTLALSRGWLELPWSEPLAGESGAPARARFDAPADGDARHIAAPVRPLRPGGLHAGDFAAGLPRS